jgi:hypothetical protein
MALGARTDSESQNSRVAGRLLGGPAPRHLGGGESGTVSQSGYAGCRVTAQDGLTG